MNLEVVKLYSAERMVVTLTRGERDINGGNCDCIIIKIINQFLLFHIFYKKNVSPQSHNAGRPARPKEAWEHATFQYQ